MSVLNRIPNNGKITVCNRVHFSVTRDKEERWNNGSIERWTSYGRAMDVKKLIQ